MHVTRNRGRVDLANETRHEPDNQYVARIESTHRDLGGHQAGCASNRGRDRFAPIQVPVAGVSFVDRNASNLAEADCTTRCGGPGELDRERVSAGESAAGVHLHEEDDQIATDKVAAIEGFDAVGELPSIPGALVIARWSCRREVQIGSLRTSHRGYRRCGCGGRDLRLLSGRTGRDSCGGKRGRRLRCLRSGRKGQFGRDRGWHLRRRRGSVGIGAGTSHASPWPLPSVSV